jgi:hypothetical protein
MHTASARAHARTHSERYYITVNNIHARMIQATTLRIFILSSLPLPLKYYLRAGLHIIKPVTKNEGLQVESWRSEHYIWCGENVTTKIRLSQFSLVIQPVTKNEGLRVCHYQNLG